MANPVTRYMEALELELQHMDGMKEVLEGMKRKGRWRPRIERKGMRGRTIAG